MSVKSAENIKNYFVKPNLRSQRGRYGMKMLLNWNPGIENLGKEVVKSQKSYLW